MSEMVNNIKNTLWPVMTLSILMFLTYGCADDGASDVNQRRTSIARDEAVADTASIKLIVQRMQKHMDGTMADRMLAARELGRTKGADEWIVLILSNPDVLYESEILAFGEGRYYFTKYNTAVLVELIEHLPEKTALPVLLALVTRLHDVNRGEYGSDVVVRPGETATVCYETDEVREVVRRRLGRQLGVNKAFDADEWRVELFRKFNESD